MKNDSNMLLNDTLDAMDVAGLTAAEAKEFRHFYEQAWNRFHLVRTAFSVLSFLLSVLAVFSSTHQ
ncbi:MAG: DUF1772 domain-containing protein [Saprospiraceae bacterium]|nr:DUF1772 domain-containing protein [Saprospiraceae bacterium]